MKDELANRSLAWASISAVSAIAACVLCLAACPAGGQTTAPTSRRGRSAPQETGPLDTVTIYRLKYAQCATVAEALQSLVAPGPGWSDLRRLMFVADDRTNSLIVTGSPAQHALVEQILKAMDVPAEPGADLTVRVYPLAHPDSVSALPSLLKSLLQPKEGIAVDPRRKLILVKAAPATHELLAELIKRVDVAAPAPGAEATRRVRIVWLVDGLPGEAERKGDLPADMKQVEQELAKVGMRSPRAAAQFILRATGAREFRAGGRAEVDGPCDVTVKGRFADRGADPMALQISITARRLDRDAGAKDTPAASSPVRRAAPPSDETLVKERPEASAREWPETPERGYAEIASLETSIIAPPGQPVVLGLTPTGKLTSAFVVTVYED